MGPAAVAKRPRTLRGRRVCSDWWWREARHGLPLRVRAAENVARKVREIPRSESLGKGDACGDWQTTATTGHSRCFPQTSRSVTLEVYASSCLTETAQSPRLRGVQSFFLCRRIDARRGTGGETSDIRAVPGKAGESSRQKWRSICRQRRSSFRSRAHCVCRHRRLIPSSKTRSGRPQAMRVVQTPRCTSVNRCFPNRPRRQSRDDIRNFCEVSVPLPSPAKRAKLLELVD